MPQEVTRTAEALRDVELWENRHKYPSQLSNGMRQRTILARALPFRTPLLLLDEPTVGLDPVTVQRVLQLIRGCLRERGQTILLTDHQSTEMEGVADRIAVLEAGEIIMQGTPLQLLERLSNLTVIEIHTEERDLPPGPPPPLVTGLYIPLSILPSWVRQLATILPPTEAFAVVRAVLLTGAGLDSHLVVSSLLGLLIVTGVADLWGYLMLRTALRRAEQRGGIGVVV